MQALMMNSDEIEIIDPSDLISVSCELDELANRQNQSVPLVELGKQLLLSAKQGDVNNVRLLMGKGAPFTTDWLGTSPLHLAASNNHVELAEILLRAGISKDSRTKVERTPLHIASQEGHIELVRLMITYDANVNALDMLKMTPLHWAVERGHIQIIKLLLDNGASVYSKNKFDKTVFDIAEDNDRLDIINILNTAASKKEELNLENDTLTASTNLAIELGQVPAASKVEEVLTSPTTKFREKSIHPKKHVKIKEEPKFSFISNHENIISSSSTLQLLQAHGITMLPADNSNLVASAVENGQTIVLTEAGKLALQNLQLGQNRKSASGAIIRKAPIQALPFPKKKLIAIKTGDIITMPKTPNILKKEVPRNIPKVTKTTVTISEFEAISKQLVEARREIDKYKQLFTNKSKEAERYKQQLDSIVNLK